jgi:hypothetical protein
MLITYLYTLLYNDFLSLTPRLIYAYISVSWIGRERKHPEMKRRQTRKVNKRRTQHGSNQRKSVRPRSVGEFLVLSEHEQDLWRNVGQAVTEMRAGASLRQASRKFGLDTRKVLQLARPALRKRRNGRWSATKSDRLLRVLPMPTDKGLVDIGVPDSSQATAVGKYWNAVDDYLGTGETSSLRFFEREFIVDADGRPVPFMTNTNELDRLGSAGNLSFESLYARVA